MNSLAPKIGHATATLGLQLAVSAGFVLLMVIIHSLGILGISRALKLNVERLKRHEMNFSGILLLGSTGLLLFLLHIFEIAVFALFYLAVDPGVTKVEDALYYSASAYATLGTSRTYIPEAWRLIGAFEGLIGFVLIGWSTAFVARTMFRLQD